MILIYGDDSYDGTYDSRNEKKRVHVDMTKKHEKFLWPPHVADLSSPPDDPRPVASSCSGDRRRA
jgi:hypothetical protein